MKVRTEATSDGLEPLTDLAQPGKKKRVLLVEDAPLERLVLFDKLKLAGLEVEVAGNKCAAMDRIADGNLDAMFLDLMLSGSQGAEVIEEARRHPGFGSRPIYACTSEASSSVLVQKAIRAGATKVFHKTLTPLEIITAEVASDLAEAGPVPTPFEPPAAPNAQTTAVTAIVAALKKDLDALCRGLQLLGQSIDPKTRAAQCEALAQRAQSVATCAAGTPRPNTARLATVLQAFLKELVQTPDHYTGSSPETCASAIEALQALSAGLANSEPVLPTLAAVVVDDEPSDGMIISNALLQAGFKPITFPEPGPALAYLEQHRVQVVVVDLLQPKLGGPHLCKKVRELPLHQKTPVILAATQRDVERCFPRTRSACSKELVLKPLPPAPKSSPFRFILSLFGRGGRRERSSSLSSAVSSDPGSHPLMGTEFALKALSLVMRNNTSSASAQTVAEPTAVPPAKPIKLVQEGPSKAPGSAMPRDSHGAATLATAKPGAANAGGTAGLPISPDVGVIHFDRDGKIIYANDECAVLFGRQKLLDIDVATLLKRGLDNEVGQFVREHNDSEYPPDPASFEVVALKHDGSEFAASVKLTQASSGSKSAWAAVFQIPASPAEPNHPAGDPPATPVSEPEETQPIPAQTPSAEGSPDPALADSQQKCERLEESLQELAAVKAELENRLADQVRANEDAELSAAHYREQLAEARAALSRLEPVHQETLARAKKLESEAETLRRACKELTEKRVPERKPDDLVSSLRVACKELTEKLTAEQQAVTQAKERQATLEDQLRGVAAELEQVKGELEKKRQEVQAKAEAAAKEARAASAERSHLDAAAAESEGHQREGGGSLTRLIVELERERVERRRLEQRGAALANQLRELHGELQQQLESESLARNRVSELEQKLGEREEEAERLRADLQKETADRQLAEEQLQAAGDMSAQLQKYLTLFEESKEVFSRTQKELESRLQASKSALTESEIRLQKEAAERQRLEEALATLQRTSQEQAERNTLELARARSELQLLQLDRKRQEGNAAQSRYASLDSVRLNRSMVENLRKKIRHPVANLLQSTRRLLEIELKDEPKEIVEALLENALLLQTSLHDTGNSGAAAGSPQPSGAQNEPRPPEAVDQAA